ncbi:NYN domain-containing protein [Candidatus Daviesbacteria bacterium]|nr:NYN domain-containing protein [Candidatus Daviesbacteria bacterium]MBI4035430.1 NYN domain-containing protein [Candidatus Daviesbacteria bacterium]
MKKKNKIVYAFIDSQNLNLGVLSQGWQLDWRKFRQYLRNKYNATDTYLFIGYKPGNEALYANLQQMGYLVILKPTMELPDKSVKGNVDAELVLHTMIQYKNYDKAIIVSGDGDFFCLVEYLESKNKLLHILAPNRRYSKLFSKYSRLVIRVDQLRGSLEFKKKTGIGGRSKP